MASSIFLYVRVSFFVFMIQMGSRFSYEKCRFFYLHTNIAHSKGC